MAEGHIAFLLNNNYLKNHFGVFVNYLAVSLLFCLHEDNLIFIGMRRVLNIEYLNILAQRRSRHCEMQIYFFRFSQSIYQANH